METIYPDIFPEDHPMKVRPDPGFEYEEEDEDYE